MLQARLLVQAREAAQFYGDTAIFSGIDLEVQAGECLALMGENGSGKTTLLRVLAGHDRPAGGTVNRMGRVALLAQQSSLPGGSVLDAVTPPELVAARETFVQASEALVTGDEAALYAFAEAEEQYRLLGGYDFEARAAAALAGLGLDGAAQASQLSGGQMRRVMLARLLLAPADLYLLDEPTNHLDTEGAQWLESWILAAASAGAGFVLASHDRAFLDAVATRTAELERDQLQVYPGNYSAAMELKATLREAQQRDYEAYKRKRAALNEEKNRLKSAGQSADRFNSRKAGNVAMLPAKNKAQNVANTLAGRAKAMQHRIDRLDAAAVAKPFDDHRRLHLDLPPVPPGPAEILSVKDLRVCYGQQNILDGLNLHVRRGDKVALTGPNGSGKSTLLRALLGELPHTGEYTGEMRWGVGLSLYSAGQHGEELRGLNTVAEALLAVNPDLTAHQLHEIAAQVGLPGPSALLATLSGGQRTRLSLARLSVTRSQVLVLDEPTNHLDIHMIEVLEDVLLAFPGTVLLASHDRRLLERVCTRRWEMNGGEVREA